MKDFQQNNCLGKEKYLNDYSEFFDYIEKDSNEKIPVIYNKEFIVKNFLSDNFILKEFE